MRVEESSGEKRGESRLRCRMPVHYRLGDKKEVHGGLLLDVGGGGLKLEMEGKPEIPSVVAVILRLPGEQKPIRVDGAVVAVTDADQEGVHRVRVVFDPQVVEEDDILRIRDYVENTTELLLGKAGAQGTEFFGRKMRAKEVAHIVDGLEMKLDNDRGTCMLGDILTFSFDQLDGQPPMTVGAMISEMLAGALTDKYGVGEDELKEALTRCKTKMNDIGKRYYMNMVRRKVSGRV